MKKTVKINHDYFSLSNKWEDVKYFIHQGHAISHLIDRFKWYYYPKNFIVPGFPNHIDIEVSSVCQMQCPMCRTTEMIKKGIGFAGFMDMGLYKQIVDECADEPLYSIKLSWRGEPLLHPQIAEMVSYAKKKGIKDVAFLSNGERLSPELSEKLVGAELDWISFSFDGMGEVYDRIRKPARFAETLEKISYLRRYREKIKIRKPLIRIQSIRSAIRGEESEFLKLWEGIADRVNFIADQKRTLERGDYRHDSEYICPSPWQRMTVSWDGKALQCCEDYMEEGVLGNVREKSLRTIWHDKAFNELRRLVKSGKRLSTKPCGICSDGGVTGVEEIVLGKRRIKSVYYIHQNIDVKDFMLK